MSYVEPAAVLSPRASVRSVEVIYSTGAGGWSLARIGWEDSQSVGIRWNGSDDEPGIGTPQSRGNPTWFILPEELHGVILEKAEDLIVTSPGGLFDQYREMANDAKHEKEAAE